MPETTDTLTDFIYASRDLLRKFHGIAKLPALPLPTGIRNASAASKENWDLGHPDASGTILNDPGSGLVACLVHWFDLADAADENADNGLRTDIANLVLTIGGRDFVMHNPIKVTAEFSRDPLGMGLRSFEGKLSALERRLSGLLVNGKPAEQGNGVDDDAVLSPAKLAELFGVPLAPLQKRLERWRKKNLMANGAYIENPDAGPRDAKYHYRVGSIRHLIHNRQNV
jgi:hypothetical protein